MRELDRLCESYGDLLRHLDPAAASAAGFVFGDGRLGQFDAVALRQHIAAFRATAAALEELEIDALADEIDRTALLEDVRATIARLEEDRPPILNPGFWVDHLVQALTSLLLRGEEPDGPSPRAEAAAERIAAIPGFLESARASLLRPPLALLDGALAELGAVGELLVEAAVRFGPDSPGGPDALNPAIAEALRALTGFGHWLRSEVEPEPGLGGAVLGEPRFERRIQHRYAVRDGPTELWRYATRLLDETEAALVADGRAIDSARHWRDLVARIDEETVPALSGLSGELERARTLLERNGIAVATVPAVVIAAPSLRGALPDLSYLPPLELPANGDARLVLLTDRLSRAALPALAATGLTGRHVQESHARGLGSEVRRRLRAPIAVQGWALYAEQWMDEIGFSPEREARLVGLARLLRAAGRLAADVGLHARGMTQADVIALLRDRAGLARGDAETEARQILAHPTDGAAAALGRREILALRSAAGVPAEGGRALHRFHADLLGFGALPPGLAGWGMELVA
jgi:hypothetical protein